MKNPKYIQQRKPTNISKIKQQIKQENSHNLFINSEGNPKNFQNQTQVEQIIPNFKSNIHLKIKNK